MEVIQDEAALKNLRLSSSMCRSIVTAILITGSTIAVCLFIQLRQTEPIPTIENVISPDFICQTPQCVIASSIILRRMNIAADPCQDFDSFACGGRENNNISDNSVLWKIHKLLENGSPDDHSRISYIVCRDLYRSCMDLKSIRQRGLKHLKEAIDMMGGFPLLMGEKWNADEKWDWLLAGQKIMITEMSEAFVTVFTSEEMDDNSPLVNRFMISFRKTNKDEHFLKELAEKLGVNGTKEIQKIIDFNKHLDEILDPNELQTSKGSNIKTLTQIQESFPFINWHLLINRSCGDESPLIGNETIDVGNPDYLSKLQELLIKTPKNIIANFLVWHLAEKMRSLLLLSEADGTKMDIRWEQCAELVKNELKDVIEFEYKQRYLQSLTDDEVIVTERIRSQFAATLNNITWISNETRKHLFIQVKHVNIVWSSQISFNESYFESQLGNLNLEPFEFYSNMVKLRMMKRKAVNENSQQWLESMSMFSSSAKSSYVHNAIYIPTRIMPDSIDSPKFPKYILYGSMGSLVGTELAMHFGFKELYQKCIELENTFKSETDSLNDYIDNYVGTQLALYAYQKWASEISMNELKMPGLQQFTAEQMFWIVSAQRLCTDRVKSSWNNKETYSIYQRGLADAFQCESETTMNLREKCKL